MYEWNDVLHICWLQLYLFYDRTYENTIKYSLHIYLHYYSVSLSFIDLDWVALATICLFTHQQIQSGLFYLVLSWTSSKWHIVFSLHGCCSSSCWEQLTFFSSIKKYVDLRVVHSVCWFITTCTAASVSFTPVTIFFITIFFHHHLSAKELASYIGR